jgi:hypothetical protein
MIIDGIFEVFHDLLEAEVVFLFGPSPTCNWQKRPGSLFGLRMKENTGFHVFFQVYHWCGRGSDWGWLYVRVTVIHLDRCLDMSAANIRHSALI